MGSNEISWTGRAPTARTRRRMVIGLLSGCLLASAGCAPPAPDPVPTQSATTPEPAPTVTVTTTPERPATLQDAYRAVAPTVVRIEVSGCSTSGSGTGFLVGEDLVATAAHVIQDNAHGRITRGAKTSAFEVVALDEKNDVALVSTAARLGGEPALLSTGQLSVGQPVATVGYSLGGNVSYHEGVINGLNRKVEIAGRTAVGLIEHSAEALPGDSGAPLISTAGEVIGIHDAGRPGMAGQRMAVAALPLVTLRDSWDGDRSSVLDDYGCNTVFDFNHRATGVSGLSTSEVDAWNTLVVRAEAINRADWPAAAAQYANGRSPGDLESGSAESQILDLEPLSFLREDGAPVIWATFTTTQPEGKGPDERPEETCTAWSVDYLFKKRNGLWLLKGSRKHDGEPMSASCEEGD